jgi:hypothetical protein
MLLGEDQPRVVLVRQYSYWWRGSKIQGHVESPVKHCGRRSQANNVK